MFCPKCGKEVKNDAQFCSECGAQIAFRNSHKKRRNETQQKLPINEKKIKKVLMEFFWGTVAVLVILAMLGEFDGIAHELFPEYFGAPDKEAVSDDEKIEERLTRNGNDNYTYVNDYTGNTMEWVDDTAHNNSYDNTLPTENSTEDVETIDGDEGMDYSLWIDDFIRTCGPAASFAIVSIDDKGIMFTAGIGASGYLAYLDMREFIAEWTDTYTAVYNDGSGYELTITLNDDRSIILSDNQPYYGGLDLSGLYMRASEAVYPDCEFVFAYSSYAYISSKECEGLNETECKIARNEIYARHGRKFDDESLQAYFDICSWYEGVLEPEDFSEDMLSEYEVENLKTIVQYEEDMGYR